MKQEQVHGGDDAYYIKGQLFDMRTTKAFNFVVKCVDHWAITTADDKHFLKKMVKSEQRAGNKFIKYIPGKQWVIENYPNMLKKQIANKIKKSLESAGANITKK